MFCFESQNNRLLILLVLLEVCSKYWPVLPNSFLAHSAKAQLFTWCPFGLISLPTIPLQMSKVEMWIFWLFSIESCRFPKEKGEKKKECICMWLNCFGALFHASTLGWDLRVGNYLEKWVELSWVESSWVKMRWVKLSRFEFRPLCIFLLTLLPFSQRLFEAKNGTAKRNLTTVKSSPLPLGVLKEATSSTLQYWSTRMHGAKKKFTGRPYYFLVHPSINRQKM